jgi:MFS family permease
MSLYSWSISIPALAAAFVTLIFGKFSDMYGRRIMLMISYGSLPVRDDPERHKSNLYFFNCRQYRISAGRWGAPSTLFLGTGRYVSAGGTQQVGWATQYTRRHICLNRSHIGRMMVCR